MDGLGLAAAPVNAYPYDMTFDDTETPAWAVNTLAANTVYLKRLPRIAVPKTITQIEYWVGTANGNVDAGYYTSTDGSTFTRVASAGSTAAAGSGEWQALVLTAPLTRVPRVDYWIAFGTDSASLTTGRLSLVNNTIPGKGSRALTKAAWSSGLPASLSSMTTGGPVVLLYGS